MTDSKTLIYRAGKFGNVLHARNLDTPEGRQRAKRADELLRGAAELGGK